MGFETTLSELLGVSRAARDGSTLVHVQALRNDFV
jgi:hypothetical protein